jgi:hypothetical protein
MDTGFFTTAIFFDIAAAHGACPDDGIHRIVIVIRMDRYFVITG